MTPSDPRAMLQHAVQLERSGNLAAAEAAYRQLLNQWPDLADTWYNLALLQKRVGRFDAALLSYQQALDRGIQQPEEVRLNRAVIFSDCLRQDAAAEAELQAALALNPVYVPALLNLANLREDFGRRNEAIDLYERLLALEPAHHEALSRFANLSTVSGPDDSLVKRLRAAIGDSTTTAADRASLGFALGKLLDECGAYDQAFAAYTQANHDSRSSASAQLIPYDRGQHERFIDALITTFSKPATAAVKAAVPTSPRPIFVCGMFRSGSTLTEQVLAGHSRVTGGGELGFLTTMVSNALSPFPAAMARQSQAQIDHLAAQYIDALSQLFPGAALVTDKRPDNFIYIGLIKRLFPDARIIHTTRNALDNCLSVFFLHLDHSLSYALDLSDIAHYYGQQQRLMTHWKSLYGEDILEFDYDRLVREPRPAIANLLAFCELEWEENCLAFERVSNAVKTASVWQVRQPLYQRSSGRWRNYAVHIGQLRDSLRELHIDAADE